MILTTGGYNGSNYYALTLRRSLGEIVFLPKKKKWLRPVSRWEITPISADGAKVAAPYLVKEGQYILLGL